MAPSAQTVHQKIESHPAVTRENALVRVAAGHRESADDLVAQYGPLVWAIANCCAGGSEIAEEVAIEIFECLFRKASEYQPALTSEADFVRSVAARCVLEREIKERGGI